MQKYLYFTLSQPGSLGRVQKLLEWLAMDCAFAFLVFLCVCVFALLINNRTFVGPDFGPVVAKVISRRQELINETNDRQHFMLLSLYPSILVFPE